MFDIARNGPDDILALVGKGEGKTYGIFLGMAIQALLIISAGQFCAAFWGASGYMTVAAVADLV